MVVSNFAKALTAATATLLKLNPDTAFDAASCAVDNNFAPHAIREFFKSIPDETSAVSETGQNTKNREDLFTLEDFFQAFDYINPEIPMFKKFEAEVTKQFDKINAMRARDNSPLYYGLGPNPSGGEGAVFSALFPTRALDLISSGFKYASKAASFGISKFGRTFGNVSRGSPLTKVTHSDSKMVSALDLAVENKASNLSAMPQIRINYENGRKFQNAVHEFLRIPENQKIYTVLLPGKGKVNTKPDLPLPKAGVTDIKNVKYITFTQQLRAQAALAREQGTCFNLIISPWTEMVSKQLSNAIKISHGKIFEYNPATGKMLERIVEKNKVIRK